MKNILTVLGYGAMMVFAFAMALSMISSVLRDTFNLLSWVIDNADWLWLPACIGYVLYVDWKEAQEKKAKGL